ncbi:PREDICTED: E3 SUMO-protein ligase NSE2-like isoform X2 [Trachymyrmex septentrionalis]|uniref:E3 SUMO-protein ligase NSE2-like isoform X2 n=1 Tax=Trachymyrmex septentrionalis TaxID=34720 RepID=UPI00084F66D0|nr:PREDICTED: E3 SUMO-protein ligase NSE2-like isoform X2 [Trachymyrmex septentrionalis]
MVRVQRDNEEEKQKILKQLRETLMANCIESARIKAANEIKEHLECMSELDSEEDVKNITTEYKKAISEIQVNPLQDNRLLEYDRQIKGLQQANKAESNAVDDADADLRLTGSEINVIDPISKMRMTDPVRNAVCGHIYDKASLVAMLQKNKNTRCPVVGCTSLDYIDLSQCRSDFVTKTYLENHPA